MAAVKKINIVPDLCEAMVDIRTIPWTGSIASLGFVGKAFPGLEIEREFFRTARSERPCSSPGRGCWNLVGRMPVRRGSAMPLCFPRGARLAVALGPGSME